MLWNLQNYHCNAYLNNSPCSVISTSSVLPRTPWALLVLRVKSSAPFTVPKTDADFPEQHAEPPWACPLHLCTLPSTPPFCSASCRIIPKSLLTHPTAQFNVPQMTWSFACVKPEIHPRSGHVSQQGPDANVSWCLCPQTPAKLHHQKPAEAPGPASSEELLRLCIFCPPPSLMPE